MECMKGGFQEGVLLGDRYRTLSPLNHGSFGMVFKARDTVTGVDVAIKCLVKPGSAGVSNCPAAMAVDEQSEELAIHSKLAGDHPNVVNLLQHWESESHQYLVIELCPNGDLYEAIRLGRGPLETEHVRDFMLQLIDALDYLHAHGVFHRDIKPENIFLTSTGSMKLGDFGLATTETWSTEFAVGSDRYMAPEQFDASVYGYGYSPAAADIWAVGVVLLNILFSRNPFATPTQSDPLFADFVHDRQSLFDVFPNMSQDTYDVLTHCMCIDPANRSLAALRQSLKNVVSFTTDDETLDDFCTPAVEFVPVVTIGREPLRTPSVNATTNGDDGYFWTSALHKTPPKTVRQLSTIRDDDESMFPGSVKSGRLYTETDGSSLSSNLDSGLGLSYKSTASKPRPSMVGSLPISFSKPIRKLMSPYGSCGDGFSKSWSDLWDEEEEEQLQERSSFEAGMDIERASTVKPLNIHAMTIKEETDRRSITPRQGLVEINANARTTSPMVIASHTPEKQSGISKSSIMDKWAALGSMRRSSKQDSATAGPASTPLKRQVSDAFNFTPFSSNKKDKSRSRSRAPSWRQTSPPPNSASLWEQKDQSLPPPMPSPSATAGSGHNNKSLWCLSNNWRQPQFTTQFPKSPPTCGQQLRDVHAHANNVKKDDIGDLEWVGGHANLL